MRRAIAPALFFLAACAQTPQQLVDEGAPRAADFPRPPAELAGCIARNAEGRSGLVAAVRSGPGEGAQEVTVRISGREGAIVVFRIEPRPGGSAVHAWFGRHISEGGAADFFGYATQGC